MIELFRRQFRKLRRFCCLAVVMLKATVEIRRLERSGPVSTPERVRILQRWSKDALAAIEVQVNVRGTAPAVGLLVSNHLSYLDILVYSSILPCAFVSKAEVEGWPFFGKYAGFSATIFVQRDVRSSSHSAAQKIAEYLQSEVAVVLFPEGTTSDGSQVQRFHSSMLQPAIDAGVPVVPCAVSYEGSDAGEKEVAWWGDMTLIPHFLNLLGKKEIRAKVVFGEPLHASEGRKALGDEARARVVALRASNSLT